MLTALYVADNRANANVGCRATSIALGDLISVGFTISGTVTGPFIKEPRPATHAAKLPFAKRIAQRALHGDLGWKVARRLPATGRPDVAMADPARLARDLIDGATGDPVLDELVDQVRAADLVVINGEGDMIFSSPPRRTLVLVLALIEVAAELGVPCAYVNAMVSDPTHGERNADVIEWSRRGLRRCSLLALRDRWSIDLVRRLDLHDDPVWVPDALFSWAGTMVDDLPEVTPYVAQGFPFEGAPIRELEGPYVCITGSSAYGPHKKAPPIDAFARMVRGLVDAGANPVLVEGSAADSFLRKVAEREDVPLLPWATNVYVLASVLGNARAFITGRHHPSILAAIGGAPLLMFGSNSHKNASLLDVIGLTPATERPASLPGSTADELVQECTELVESWTSERRAELQARCRELGEQASQLSTLLEKAAS